MMNYVTIVVCMLLLPLFYCGALLWYRSSFKKEENQTRKPFQAWWEYVVVALSEVALFVFWYLSGQPDFLNLTFDLIYVMLVGTTFFCTTDLLEQVVPNKIILLLVLLFFIIVGLHAVNQMDTVTKLLPSIILGFIFSLLTFGLGYIVAKGRMGAGDVKLVLLMGLFLTGKYVVAVVLYGCVASAVYSLVQLIRKKVTKETAIPFVPFLYIGLIIRLMMG